MYANLWNHIFNISHYLLAFVILYILYPRLIFKPAYESALDSVISNYIRMIFLIICTGYLLVIFKIFEFLGLAIALGLLLIYSFIRRTAKADAKSIMVGMNAYVYDVVDGFKSPVKLIKGRLGSWRQDIRKRFAHRMTNSFGWFDAAIIAIVFAFAAYLRFFDAYCNAAPGMSDGNVTLAWIKYIIQRRLFADGIYPQGFHLNMAAIQKIAFINPLYVLKYSGPLDGVMIMAGIYFFLYKCTGRSVPGIAGASLYGIFGNYLSMEWMRQAASNSQEFGFVFVLPVLYFTLRYIQKEDKDSFWTYFLGISAIGLIHAIAYAFAAIGVILLAFAALILNYKKHIKSVAKIAIAGFSSGIIALAPIAAGLLMGKAFHGSSVQYLSSTTSYIFFPKLDYLDYMAMASVALIFLFVLFNIRKRQTLLPEVFVIFFACFAFFMFYYGGNLTQSEMVLTRFPDMWILAMTISIGMALNILGKIIWNKKIRKAVELILISAFLILGVLYAKPQPILTYKMERNEEVEQYLNITKLCNPTQWMMVANFEGAYAQVLGVGTHIRIEDFVKEYNPAEEILVYKGSDHIIPDIFIYQDKQFFSTGFANKQQEYEDRKLRNKEIALWLEAYMKVHPDRISLMYEDESFRVFHIHQIETKDNIIEKIWNYGGENKQ